VGLGKSQTQRFLVIFLLKEVFTNVPGKRMVRWVETGRRVLYFFSKDNHRWAVALYRRKGHSKAGLAWPLLI
jgi:hypothetical protein